MTDTATLIQSRLEAAFSPAYLAIRDESHLHIGHAGGQSGKGHFALTIQADHFEGKSVIDRHKMIYQALGRLMTTHIHALSINIIT